MLTFWDIMEAFCVALCCAECGQILQPSPPPQMESAETRRELFDAPKNRITGYLEELPNIAAHAYQDVHVWSPLLTCLQPHMVLKWPLAGPVVKADFSYTCAAVRFHQELI